MGLDQSLYRRNADGATSEVIYWRKVNFVHRYFTDDWINRGFDDDNCTEFPVTEEDLRDLLEKCEEVLADRKNAWQILPTMDGFFFGSTKYDVWYFDDVEETRTQLLELLEDPLKDGDSYFYYAWY